MKPKMNLKTYLIDKHIFVQYRGSTYLLLLIIFSAPTYKVQSYASDLKLTRTLCRRAPK